MTMMKMLAAGAGIAALGLAAPAAAQYPYGYAQPYGYANSYVYNSAQLATQQCTAAVQHRLSTRTGIGGIVGAMLGVSSPSGRVMGVTEVTPRRSTVRVRGLATSGRSYGYGPYGVGAYGALGYSYQPDLSFKCDVDYRGRIVDLDIYRR